MRNVQLERNNIITGKLIVLDRGTAKEQAGDESDRRLIMVGGILALPKDHDLVKRILVADQLACVGILAGYNGGLALHYLEDLPPWNKGSLSYMMTNYQDWRV